MFKLVVVILCFATLLVSTGSALKKDEYEINIKHGSFAVHQLHVNADSPREGTSRSEPLAPTIAPGSASKENGQQRNEQFFGAVNAERGSAGARGSAGDSDGERISTTLAVPKPTVQSAKKVTTGEVFPSVKPIKSIDFNAVSPGLEDVPLQPNIFQSSQGRGQNRVLSYQSVEYYPPDEVTVEQDAIVRPISAQDFYNTPQLRERGPVLFATDPTTTTTTTTTVKPPGKLLKSIPKSAVEENEEIYLLLKYENPRKKMEAQANTNSRSEASDQNKNNANRDRQRTIETSRTSQQTIRPSAGTRKRPQAEEGRQPDDFLQESLRTGGSFTTVGYFVSDTETTTSMAPVSTSTTKAEAASTPSKESSGWNTQVRVSSGKLRNSYGDYLSSDFKDFEDSIRPIEENVEETPESGADDEKEDSIEEEVTSGPADIDANMDIVEMTRILAGRQGGLTISEFNRLFKDYLKKEITVQDLEDFTKLENADKEPPKETSANEDPSKSFDIRAENGKKIAKVGDNLPGPTPAQKQQLDQLKVLVNKGSLKPGRKEKLVKIGYGGSKSFQGVFKSQKFLEKVKSERIPVPPEGLWGGLEYRQQQPAREIGPMAYVDNPVFGFAPGGRTRAGIKDGQKSSNGGQSYVKFQKIS
ncbi:uncharacterized protein LOC125768840 isoform X2 [Anopheles funestus]|uniref:uncharacterized protein LOC125768840 isoform X2 n=1 Tax=Anopheles funestus TaxID=62324 RepID=UPI0020C607D6|nr:uncharacterized protein LOC125768840 isoform X2 [Anopheles funestus]